MQFNVSCVFKVLCILYRLIWQVSRHLEIHVDEKVSFPFFLSLINLPIFHAEVIVYKGLKNHLSRFSVWNHFNRLVFVSNSTNKFTFVVCAQNVSAPCEARVNYSSCTTY